MKDFFRESAIAIESLAKLSPQCEILAKKFIDVHLSGGSILVAGNGGSFSDALHFVGELTCTYKSPARRGLRAISLGANGSAITAWANDFGFESFYQRQVDAIGKTGDVLVLISTGGGSDSGGYSANLVNAMNLAKEKGIYTVGLVGKGGGVIGRNADLVLHVESFSTAVVQQCHIVLIHKICELLEHFE